MDEIERVFRNWVDDVTAPVVANLCRIVSARKTPYVKRSRGAVTGTAITVRLQPELLARLDVQRGAVSRPEAIRSILEQSLPAL